MSSYEWGKAEEFKVNEFETGPNYALGNALKDTLIPAQDRIDP